MKLDSMKLDKLGKTFEEIRVDEFNKYNVYENFSTNSTSVCLLMGGAVSGGISASVTFIINIII